MSVSAVSRRIRSAAVLGVSGTRTAAPGCVRAVTWALSQCQLGAAVVTGCMSGIDAVARQLAPSAQVFHASSYPGPAPFARRSIATVQHVARAAGGPARALWLSAPGRACPAGLSPSASPSACFSGSGSGSWASLALALGVGVPALVWLPSVSGRPVAPPVGWPLAQVCAGRAGAWWGSTVATQATLF